MNLALFGKIAWRLILEQPQSLLAKVMLSNYCHGKEFLEVGIPSSATWIWQGIIKGRDFLKKGLQTLSLRVWFAL